MKVFAVTPSPGAHPASPAKTKKSKDPEKQQQRFDFKKSKDPQKQQELR
jgi:hypothetical protein